jgi:transposase InsO family protein
MDFKGWVHLDNVKRCYPFTVLDDHSRYNLVLEACPGESESVVRPPLIKAFRRFGLPRQILCDYGNPWGKGLGPDGKQMGTPSFEVWLMRLGVELIHCRVRHPQTQGKEERFHQTLKVEVLERECSWRDLPHCQSAFRQW